MHHVTARGGGRLSRAAETPGGHLATASRRAMETRSRELQAAEYLEKHRIKELMMDSSNRGTISFVQYKEALKTLGLCTEDEDLEDDGHRITLEQFKDEVNKRITEIWSAF
ncbi:EF-hand calcium-binding domain-containing protein 10 isoform X2 [Cebus imitator]|uniref:EF-hand calcium-binding domain-containing protein 10 isoform X2 n=1 Tax=Cebus imitator TaxID=2715852 RepID=UPI00189B5A5D|nr:EF-hand calcium-binding domain-containing protein 10 isoform X2 [Cebus imitator]